MRARNIITLLCAAVVALFATAALAIQPVVVTVSEEAREAARNEIKTMLGRDNSFALLIGIDTFDDPAWPQLSGIRREINDMAAVFDRDNFNVEVRNSGRMSLLEMKQAIADFVRLHGDDPDNRLVVYIATHGYADAELSEDERKTGYFITSDSKAPLDGAVNTAYSTDDLTQAFSLASSRHVFFFFDSCFSGAMLATFSRGQNDLLAQQPEFPLSEEAVKWTKSLLAKNARLALTAGNSEQTVPDTNNPYPRALRDGLEGKADANGDGLILGSELALYVRSRVTLETAARGIDNNPVFAVLPRKNAAGEIILDAESDFVFLSPLGAMSSAINGKSEQEALLIDQQARLGTGQFVECVDCPPMRQIAGFKQRVALARTEATYAQWDACFREMGCTRYLPDDGLGRGDRPAGNVTWRDALEFSKWLSDKVAGRADAYCERYEVPSEEQWRAAALYSNGGPLDWSAAVTQSQPVCLGCGTGNDGIAALRTASSPANEAGYYDMVGNLWEWVRDDGAAMHDLLDARPQSAPLRPNIDVAPQSLPSGDACNLGWFLESTVDRCADGAVMGGSYATGADQLAGAEWGPLPRTGIRNPFELPTVGLRVACVMKKQG